MIRAMHHENIDSMVELLGWCRNYQKRGPGYRPDLERFGIGTYQISQALGWSCAGPVAWQSCCAAFLHAAMAAEDLDLGLEQHLPATVHEISEAFPGYHTIIIHQGKAMQQMLYGMAGSMPHWKRRYRPGILCCALASFAELCLQMVPAYYRPKGISDEMSLLCGDVVIK